MVSEEKINMAIEMYQNGMSLAQISKNMQIDAYSTLSKKLKECGIEIINKQNNQYSANYNFFEDINTEEKAYWLGFLYADGYVAQHLRKDGKLKSRLEIGLHKKDLDQLEKFKISLKSNHKIYLSQLHKNRVTLEIYNKKMCSDLIKNGCVQLKSKIIRFPFFLDQSLWGHFLRGYSDGDGCVFVNKSGSGYMNICSGSELFIKDIAGIYEKMGLPIKITKGKRVWILRFSNKKTINFQYKYLYGKATICMNRKFTKAQKLLEYSERQKSEF